MKVRILTEKALRQVVRVDRAAVDAVERAFGWLAEGRVEMPPVQHIEVADHEGDVDIKSAYVRGLDRFAVKIGAGFFRNASLGLPSSPAMMVVLSARTGFAEAVLLDNAYLTDVRTGAAGAVAARHLAPRTVRTAGVIGTGAQGRYQMIGLRTAREFVRLLAFDRDAESLDRYVREMGERLGVEVVAASGPEEVVRASQVVVTCTPSRRPYLRAEWLHPGLHITAMGADLPDKQELDAAVAARADIAACDRKTQSFTMGELRRPFETGVLSESSPVVELGEIVLGRVSGRSSEEQITLCDLTGTGVQDTAIAHLALEEAGRQGLGTDIEMEG